MKRILWALTAVGLSGIASAVTIAPCNTCWAPFDPATIVDATGVSSNPYFVNQSQDGSKQGLAFQLYQYAPLQYQTSGNAAPADAPAGFYFLNRPGQQLQAQFLMGVTQDNLEFGWYDVQNPGNLNKLFTRLGPTSSPNVVPSGTVTFNPTTEFGFYVKYLNVGIPGNICAALSDTGTHALYAAGSSSCYDSSAPAITTNQVVYTQSGLNSTGPNTEVAWEQVAANIPANLSTYHQHFVALQNPNTNSFIIGMEDSFGRDSVQNRGPLPLAVYEGNGDYQDLAVAFGEAAPASPVSEPSMFLIVGAGLAVLMTNRMRRARG